jgi:hypothetical protein
LSLSSTFRSSDGENREVVACIQEEHFICASEDDALALKAVLALKTIVCAFESASYEGDRFLMTTRTALAYVGVTQKPLVTTDMQ